MRITHFINQYPKVSHTFIRREIMALERQGFEVQRIALRGWDEQLLDADDIHEQTLTQYVLKQGIAGLLWSALCIKLQHPIRFFKAFICAMKMGVRADRPIPYHFIYLLEACQTLRLMQQFKSQHIHAHFGTNPSEIAMLVHILSGISYSFTVHGPEEFDRPQFLKLKQKIEQSKFVVAISSFGRSQLQRWVDFAHWPKIKVVHCGLEPSFYQDASKDVSSSNKLVCVGRLCEQKGQLLLIEAAKQLAERGIDFELILAGDGHLPGEHLRRTRRRAEHSGGHPRPHGVHRGDAGTHGHPAAADRVGAVRLGRQFELADALEAQPFLTLSTCLRRPSVAVSTPPFMVRFRMNPGRGTERSMVMSNRTLVLSPSGVRV